VTKYACSGVPYVWQVNVQTAPQTKLLVPGTGGEQGRQQGQQGQYLVFLLGLAVNCGCCRCMCCARAAKGPQHRRLRYRSCSPLFRSGTCLACYPPPCPVLPRLSLKY